MSLKFITKGNFKIKVTYLLPNLYFPNWSKMVRRREWVIATGELKSPCDVKGSLSGEEGDERGEGATSWEPQAESQGTQSGGSEGHAV